MSISKPRIHLLLIAALVLLFQAGCGGGGSGASQTTTAEKPVGSVGVLLTDKPADPDLFSAINLTLVKAELLGDAGPVVLFSGEATYDLLQLRNESAPFTFNDEVPVGAYCKVRLTLAVNGLELVLADDTPETMADNETYYPKLTGNRKIDLLARDCFVVTPGGSVTLQLDMSAGDSIHIVERGNKLDYNFRPVVFIDVLNQDLSSRLIRVEGDIAWVDADAGSLLLCNALATHDDSERDCVLVNLSGDSALFDNLRLNGAPVPLSDLLKPENLGQHATIVGLFQSLVESYPALKIDDEDLPGADDCRVWHAGVEANQQPLATACDTLMTTQIEPGALVIDDQGQVIEDHRPLLAMLGLAVELGDFLSLDGVVLSDVGTSSFAMGVNPGQALFADSLLVELQAGGADYNGTRILSKSGALLNSTAILPILPVTVDGVRLTDVDPLQAAVVILDTESIGLTQVTGTLINLGVNAFELQPGAGESPCGVTAPNLLTVVMADNVARYTQTLTDTETLVESGGDLQSGQSLMLAGQCNGAEFIAETLIIVVDQTTPSP